MVLQPRMQPTTPVLAVPGDRLQGIPTAQGVARRAQTERLFFRSLHRFPIQELCRAFPHPRAAAIQKVFLLRRNVQPVEAVSEILPDGFHDLDLLANGHCFDVFRCHGATIPQPWRACQLHFCIKRRPPAGCRLNCAGVMKFPCLPGDRSLYDFDGGMFDAGVEGGEFHAFAQSQLRKVEIG